MAAAGGSLKEIFENPIPDPLSSWTQLLPKAETETSFDVFGDICQRVKPESPSSSSNSNYPPLPPMPPVPSIPSPRLDKSSSWNGTKSQPEEKPFPIFGNPVELKLNTTPRKFGRKDADNDGVNEEEKEQKVIYTRSYSDVRPNCSVNCTTGLFPPPITSIGRYGKPRVYFKSKKEDGRFVLREIRIPTQRLLQATREDGRLRMQVVGPVEDTAAGRGEEKVEADQNREEEDAEGEEERWNEKLI